jgi:hypothetical protein
VEVARKIVRVSRAAFAPLVEHGTLVTPVAHKCHSQAGLEALFFYVSSSGGGLPGRPVTRKSQDACLFWDEIFLIKNSSR